MLGHPADIRQVDFTVPKKVRAVIIEAIVVLRKYHDIKQIDLPVSIQVRTVEFESKPGT